MEAIITAIIGFFSGGVGAAIVSGLFSRRKNNADANRESSNAWKEFAEKMEKKQEELEQENIQIRLVQKAQDKKLERFARRIIYLQNGIEVLVNQIISDGKSPCWSPDEWNPDEE